MQRSEETLEGTDLALVTRNRRAILHLLKHRIVRSRQ